MTTMPTVLTIAGSDSSGGAGIQADLATFASLGLHGASVVTAVTAQDTTGVAAWEAVSPALVRSQLECVLGDLEVVAAKTGMLATASVVLAVAAELEKHECPAVVCDPVLAASTGDSLFDGDDLDALTSRLLPLVALVTPNATEAELLTGRRVRTVAQAEQAGRALLETGVGGVFVTGGHLEEGRATDVLVTAQGARELPGEWIDTPHTHGTGCVLSAAIAGYLGRGLSLLDAVARAKDFVTNAIRGGRRIGRGPGAVDPSVGKPR